eukprot:4600111-Pleurochrysis_carterae.AAC.3
MMHMTPRRSESKSPRLRSASAVGSWYNDGQPCRHPVEYTAPHHCKKGLSRSITGMRITRPRLHAWVRVSAEPWQHNIGNDASKKLARMEQAQSGIAL